ncbi:hypothetical protein RMATCC62417_14172 [Rhizopus microsporus]|nr:hypothetical protein RMATCC62417_14172 [Rhizopus microsporus]
MSKPYLSRNGHLFDSMLELKMENDRLKHRVRQLSSLSKQIVSNEEHDTQLPAFFLSDEEKNTLLEDNRMNNVKNDYSLKTSPSPLSPIAYSKLAISAGSSSNMPREPSISSQEEWENPRGAHPIKKSPGSIISTTPAGNQMQNQTTVSLHPLSVDDEGDIPIKKSNLVLKRASESNLGNTFVMIVEQLHHRNGEKDQTALKRKKRLPFKVTELMHLS